MNRWLVPVTAVSLVLNAALAFTLVSQAKNAEAVPYAIEVDGDEGRVASHRASREQFRQQVEGDQMLLTSQVRGFVSDLLTIDPYLTNDNLKRLKSHLRGEANSDYRDYMIGEAPLERLQKTDGLTRTVDPIKVELAQRGLAFVSAQTNERVGASSPVVRSWRLTIHYAIDPALDEQSMASNPVGFEVSHFTRAVETEK